MVLTSEGNLFNPTFYDDIINKQQGVNETVSGSLWTPLMYAASLGRHDLIKKLIDLGADVNLMINNTALHACCSSACVNDSDLIECLKLLIDHGVDLNQADVQGLTPLMIACREGQLGIVKTLCSNKCIRLEQTDDLGLTALSYAYACGFDDIVNFLIEKGADSSCLNDDVMAEKFYDLGSSHGKSEELFLLDNFLSALNLSPLLKSLQQNGVTFEMLTMCDYDKLKTLGIVKVGDRIKILEALKFFHATLWKPNCIPSRFVDDFSLWESSSFPLFFTIFTHCSLMKRSTQYILSLCEHKTPDLLEQLRELTCSIKQLRIELMKLKNLLSESDLPVLPYNDCSHFHSRSSFITRKAAILIPALMITGFVLFKVWRR